MDQDSPLSFKFFLLKLSGSSGHVHCLAMQKNKRKRKKKRPNLWDSSFSHVSPHRNLEDSGGFCQHGHVEMLRPALFGPCCFLLRLSPKIIILEQKFALECVYKLFKNGTSASLLTFCCVKLEHCAYVNVRTCRGSVQLFGDDGPNSGKRLIQSISI